MVAVMMPISTNLKRLRMNAGLTQQALAMAAGLSVSIVSMIEQGANDDPKVSTIKALANALGCQVDDLIEEEPAPKRRRKAADAGGEE